jgi:beta-D-galactosyl-(1->4)-L-rhamnose phosphorylase
MEKDFTQGSFTLPGEAGYEDLTLRLAKKWGADIIRDSDGTQLSDEIIESDYGIYSTICLVRGHNEWAKKNKDKLQQCYLMSEPVLAKEESLTIELLKGYSKEQLAVNKDDEPQEWWQVFDRTTGEEVPKEAWSFDAKSDTLKIEGAKKWHKYTVNFLAYRIWEEISAYNHITNNWGDREHLMPIEPMHEEAQEQILTFLKNWLEEHPHTKVVRFTSLFYNFWWLWGADPKQRFIVNDWGSYGSSVSSVAIRKFEKLKGYRPTSEDFVNKGLYTNSYLPPTPFYVEWMDFIIEFVTSFGKKCIDLVHEYGKEAYVFYNDHWIGMEPTLDSFEKFGFDGMIDGIFNGFETRKVASTKHVKTKELRLHPYLFPTGVNGAGTFVEGGNPTLEAKTYWTDIRRALLREPVDRIGFGGYLHLVEDHPEFVDYVEALAKEFRMLKSLHEGDAPYTADVKVAILTAWGNRRAWGCRGHYNHGNYYNEVMEAVSGLPVEVVFISFEDILTKGIDTSIDVIINAGNEADAWSGGFNWKNAKVVEALHSFVEAGGGLIGVGEPSAVREGDTYFKLDTLLGVDKEYGLTIAFDRYPYEKFNGKHFILEDVKEALTLTPYEEKVFLKDKEAVVLADNEKGILLATNTFGKGRSIYAAGYHYTTENVRLLHRMIFWAAGKEERFKQWTSSNPNVECSYHPKQGKLVVINNTDAPQQTTIYGEEGKTYAITLPAWGCIIQ